MSSGFLGPTDETRRDPLRPASWTGISATEREYLGRWLDGMEVKPDEVHTNVSIGETDPDCLVEAEHSHRELYRKLWARRIDAALRFGDDWWLVELKKDAAHYVLGQVLCYAFWWYRDCRESTLVRSVVVTNHCCADVRVVLEACGVDVVELDSGSPESQ